MVTIEDIAESANMNKALRQVISNKGAPGVDGMRVEDIRAYLLGNGRAKKLSESIKSGTYRPKAVRRVYIPKEGTNQKRPLGIPCVIDRLVQQALAQKLSEHYEPKFIDESYGFRPNRSAQQAVRKVCEYGNMGYRWVVDMDLAKFFDTVNHEKLLEIVSKEIKDKRVLALIHKFLRAPVVEDGKTVQTTIGTPQGGCCSPILANILLNELDQELKRRGIPVVRYADDMVLFCKSERSATRVLSNIVPFIENKLLLKVNKQKTKIIKIIDLEGKFLGFSFRNWRTSKQAPVEVRPVPHPKSWDRLKRKVKGILKRSRGWSASKYQEELNPVIRGWANYFKIGRAKTRQIEMDGWIRTRIRQIYWKQWRTSRRRREATLKLTGQEWIAQANARATKRYWANAQAVPLKFGLQNEAIRKLGWMTIGDVWNETSPLMTV